jgi:ubiquinone/menaquinone biosynthesis methyltransferase
LRSYPEIEFVCANAEQLPFQDAQFDAYTISFGLRNVPRTRLALAEAQRVLKMGGRFMCLEFSKVQNAVLREIYRQYSFLVIPEVGQLVANDRSSYQYLVESIEKFLTQEQLLRVMQEVGFSNARFTNYTDGIVAIHSAFKLTK